MTATAGTSQASEPVQDYLDKLLLTLTGSPRHIRYTLAEVEAHLQDAVAEGLAAGLPDAEAQAAAVRRFGPPSAVTGHTAQFAQPTAALLRRAVLAGSLIGGVGLVAIGVAGAISWALASLAGGSFVTAPFPPGSYTQADCARWLAGDPGTRSCVTAMTADHIGDIVLWSCAAGVLGLLALLVSGVLQLRWRDHGTLTALPAGSAEAAGLILAGLVMVATLGMALNQETATRGVGAGQHFSEAAAALAAAAFFAVRLRRTGLSGPGPLSGEIRRGRRPAGPGGGC
ncbi:MAG TPA: permease prefix domain 1-containing protein [Streptosporangiaceae bacterium]|nr:permease prefix domain 1-containing protein [Streptosporangiaceae bacterium]